MRTKRITTNTTEIKRGEASGEATMITYSCPCGEGEIVEEHDDIPGFRSNDVWCTCEKCRQKYRIDTSKGISNWELIERVPVSISENDSSFLVRVGAESEEELIPKDSIPKAVRELFDCLCSAETEVIFEK